MKKLWLILCLTAVALPFSCEQESGIPEKDHRDLRGRVTEMETGLGVDSIELEFRSCRHCFDCSTSLYCKAITAADGTFRSYFYGENCFLLYVHSPRITTVDSNGVEHTQLKYQQFECSGKIYSIYFDMISRDADEFIDIRLIRNP